MSAPVDVLAVLDRYRWLLSTALVVGDLRAKILREHDAMRVSLADLIEADREYDAAISVLKDLNRRIAEQGWIEVEFDALRKAGERVVAAQIRRDAALANVGGRP